ncbi:hypothetical protein D3C80_1377820 [compost metagenome]
MVERPHDHAWHTLAQVLHYGMLSRQLAGSIGVHWDAGRVFIQQLATFEALAVHLGRANKQGEAPRRVRLQFLHQVQSADDVGMPGQQGLLEADGNIRYRSQMHQMCGLDALDNCLDLSPITNVHHLVVAFGWRRG